MFDADGRRLGAFGHAGDGTGDFAKAKGIALDSEGHIYVVDSLFDVVQVFDREGRLLLVFGGSGRDAPSLWLPTGICIDEKDRIYVSDSSNSRVQVYQYLRATE
jgi:sugar lactone lactonase YvrE